MIARWEKLTFRFRFNAGTSRGVLQEKTSYFILIQENGITGIGECSTIPKISIDCLPDYEIILSECITNVNDGKGIDESILLRYPSIAFGMETAYRDLKFGGKHLLYDTPFTQGKQGISINGLVWMGSRDFMEKQIREKLDSGFRCIKLKVGSLDFTTELDIIRTIRKEFKPELLDLRLDANGAFGLTDAPEKLKRLSEFQIHSIEQPIEKGQWQELASICEKSPVPVALDEELTGITKYSSKEKLINTIKPRYIVLKPSMIGGIKASEEWISIANKSKTGWWITSALESNVGLNAIAQWTLQFNNKMPQGLGTGQLYENNISSPLYIQKDALFYQTNGIWDMNGVLK